MRANQNKSLKIVIIILVILLLLIGISVAIYFILKNRDMRYYKVELSTSADGLNLSSNSKTLAPNSDIINRPVVVSVSNKSASAFIRAKIVFISYSEDNRVLSFVNQLNYYIKDTETHIGNGYSWQYYENDNSFYLLGPDSNLKVVSSSDNNYYFLDTLKVPNQIKQISSLNSDGENVQIGEDIEINIIFEAVQSIDLIGNKTPSIENVRTYFNNFAEFNENGFVSENGFITKYTGDAQNLILPKFVGEDYIIGIKENAFTSINLQKVIIPGSYIYFKENAFSNCTNLNYVAIKSETPIKLNESSFAAKANLEIYTPNDNLNYIRQNYPAISYLNNFKSYTTVVTNKTSEIDVNATTIYAPNVTEFVGDFKNFTKLKLLIAPSLTKINEEMFKNNTILIECDTPNVVNIGNNAFNGCKSLINASFSKKLQTIGENSFTDCEKLLNINFAKPLSVIPKEAFRGCKAITSVILEKEDVMLLNGAFYNCSNLRIIDINKLSKIDSNALSECSNLRYINIGRLNTTDINTNCVDNSSNALFVFNDSVNKTNFINSIDSLKNKAILIGIENNVLTKFEGEIRNLNLTEFNLIEKIIEIGNNAFKDNTTLNTLIIPSSVKKIGDNFISGCENLNSLTINCPIVPETTQNTFNEAKNYLTIYVPEKSLDVYRKTFENYNFVFLNIN